MIAWVSNDAAVVNSVLVELNALFHIKTIISENGVVTNQNLL